MAFAAPGGAAGDGAAALPEPLRADAPALGLVGAGALTWWGFSVYDARLYAEDARFGFDRHFALELEYARDFAAEDIVEVSVEEMRRLSGASDSELARWRAAMADIFPDVRDGDRLIGMHDPAGAVSFYDRTGLLGRIEDAGFARAFFAIWLDPETKSEDLRRELLGLAADAGADGRSRATGFSPTN